MKGTIALDIDGTVTDESHRIPSAVVDFLHSLEDEGWKLIFITGRPFAWGWETLQQLHFPFFFGVQNGALILQMPERRIVERQYLDMSILPTIEEICKEEGTGYVVYGGYELQDRCFWRPETFTSSLAEYLEWRQKKIPEMWSSVASFEELPSRAFPSFKCFGDREKMETLQQEIVHRLHLHAPLLRDPLNKAVYLIQATAPHVDKGFALKELIKTQHHQGPIIAAGDDWNDESMFKVADVKVVMETAPKEVLQMGDIIAPSAKKEGLIQGLKEAIKRVR